MILTIIAFVIIFSVLVLVHEWGHFAAARKAGIKVEEFGVGLPPKAKTVFTDKKGTLYTLNWIPFGGFVRLFGEDSSDPKILKDKKSFASKTLWQRTQVIVAGVFMNFVLAWLLIAIGFTVGMKPFVVTEQDIKRGVEAGYIESTRGYYVHEVMENSGFTGSDFQAGSFIVEINGDKITQKTSLSEIIQPGERVEIKYYDSTGSELKTIIANANEEGKLGIMIGLQDRVGNIKVIRYPFYIAPFKAIQEVGRLSYLTVDMLGRVVSNLVGQLTIPEGVAGPVGIFRLTGQYAQEGIMSLIQFTALLSISLGVINIMPFPALDGGRFLFIVFELITRRKANAKWEAIIHSVGFMLLMILILIITWNDIADLLVR